MTSAGSIDGAPARWLARAVSGPIVLASRNPGKLAELQLLAGRALDLRLLGDDPTPPPVDEDQESYLGNARKKALAIARFVGGPALADDSGLEVDALGGRPGVLSARYGGPELDDRARCDRLLAELAGARERRARFRCVLVLADGAESISAEGVLEGEIAISARGTGGFGYDPIFAVPALGGRTLGEVESTTKSGLSHRAAAMRSLLVALGRDVAPRE